MLGFFPHLSRLLLGLSVSLLLGGCDKEEINDVETYVNEPSEERMLLVLSAPSIYDDYYAEALPLIVDFHINYCKAIMDNDNVVLIVDEDTKGYYEGKLPEDVLITAEVFDIWMRDFTTVNPENPVRFTYTWASMTQAESREVQQSFEAFANSFQLDYTSTPLLVDGGNIVDDYAGRAITTTRFLEDNNLSYDEGKQELMRLLNASEVAIIEPDEEVLAHSDGMVSWVDENVLLVNDYSEDPEFKALVMDELKASFPSASIVEVPVAYTTNPPGVWEGFESACGVNLNATATYNNLYVPVFNMPHEEEALHIIRANTSKEVIEVNAEGVCPMGGSVRCLTWQLTGQNAQRLIMAARLN